MSCAVVGVAVDARGTLYIADAGSDQLRKVTPDGVISSFVYLVDTNANTVAVRPVTLGVIDGEHVAVTKGLEAGDLVAGVPGHVDGSGLALTERAGPLRAALSPRRPAPADGGRRASARSQTVTGLVSFAVRARNSALTHARRITARPSSACGTAPSRPNSDGM